MKAGILGMGRYIPEKVLTNHDLEKMVETSDEWIRTRTGIEEEESPQTTSFHHIWLLQLQNKRLNKLKWLLRTWI